MGRGLRLTLRRVQIRFFIRFTINDNFHRWGNSTVAAIGNHADWGTNGAPLMIQIAIFWWPLVPCNTSLFHWHGALSYIAATVIITVKCRWYNTKSCDLLQKMSFLGHNWILSEDIQKWCYEWQGGFINEDKSYIANKVTILAMATVIRVQLQQC